MLEYWKEVGGSILDCAVSNGKQKAQIFVRKLFLKY